MQARILDFASDAITKQLQKIDKDDVKKIMTNVTGSKSQAKSQATPSTKNDDPKNASVTNSDEYLRMMQKEFNFSPSSAKQDEKTLKSAQITESNDKVPDEKDGLLKKTVSVNEEKCEIIEIPENDAPPPPESVIDMHNSSSSISEPNRQYTNEVQSFVQKKNIAQGMMDLALVSANCNQLRYVLDMNDLHPYYTVSIILIGTSLALQIIVGLGLLYSNSYNLRQNAHMKAANKFSNISVIGVFLITIINVLISTFNGSNFSGSDLTSKAPSSTLATTAESYQDIVVPTETATNY